MNARRGVIDHIRTTFVMPKEPYKTVFHLPDIMLPPEKDIPPLEIFMLPEPDVEGRDDDYGPINCHPKPASALGSYRSMHSPGRITLNKQNLTQLFWRLALDIEKALPQIHWTEGDLRKLAEWTVDKTFWHERFHHSMDVLRHLLDVQTFDSWHE